MHVPDCPFCSLHVFVVETEHAVAFRDCFPVAEGHTLVAPRRHVDSVFNLPGAEFDSLWRVVAEVRERLRREMRPDGFTIGVNDGVTAGQTVTHGHIHVIPRHTGDVPDPRGGIRWVLPERACYWDPPM